MRHSRTEVQDYLKMEDELKARVKEEDLPRFHLYHDGDVANFPDPEWIIDGILPANALGELYGSWEIGKSFLAFDWALCIATGTPWGEREVKKGPVVYVYAEGRSGLKQRVAAWKSQHGLPADEMAGEGVYFLPSDLQLSSSKDVREFGDSVFEQVSRQPVLVVIDTLARCMVGMEESSAKDMGQIIQAADQLRRRFEATVLVIHHCGHDGAHGRGSSALPAALDSIFTLKRKFGGLELICEKQKDAAEFNTIKLELVPTLDSCTVSVVGDSVSRNHNSVSSGAISCLGSLDEFGPEGATSSAWFDAWQKKTSGGKSTFQRHLAQLKENGCLNGGGRGIEYTISESGDILLSPNRAIASNE